MFELAFSELIGNSTVSSLLKRRLRFISYSDVPYSHRLCHKNLNYASTLLQCSFPIIIAVGMYLVLLYH